jgi:hypothetical protein
MRDQTDGSGRQTAARRQMRSAQAQGGRYAASARSGQLSTAETNQRKKAALASANKRRGTGTKQKNPQTPHTKAKERVRRRSNQDAPKQTSSNSNDQVKTALIGIKNALAADEPIMVSAKQLMSTVQRLRSTGWEVKTRGKRGVSITLKDGRTLKLEAQ